MRRLSDIVAESVIMAIAALEIPEADRKVIEWEAAPAISSTDGSIGWFLGIGLPVPVTGDSVMPFTPVGDPHDAEEISRKVRALYQLAAGQAAHATELAVNGVRQSGGLIVP